MMRFTSSVSIWSLLTVLLLAGLCGCRSTTYYQDRAVQRARTYLLDEAGPQLTREQREYVKFNQPILLTAPIMEEVPFGLNQTCITWVIPGCPEACMVFGTSARRMMDWSPNRIIWRDFAPWDQKRDKAIQSARDYAINNLFFSLNTAQFNRLRFDNPEILHTDFDLVDEFVGEVDETVLKQLNSDQKTQFAIVWKFPDDPSKCVVICGLSDVDLGGWTINFGAILSDAEVAERTLEQSLQVSLDAVHFSKLPGNVAPFLPTPVANPSPEAFYAEEMTGPITEISTD